MPSAMWASWKVPVCLFTNETTRVNAAGTVGQCGVLVNQAVNQAVAVNLWLQPFFLQQLADLGCRAGLQSAVKEFVI